MPKACARTEYWLHGWENLPSSTIFGTLWGLCDPYRVQKVYPYTKTIGGTWRSTHVISNLVNKLLVLGQNNPKRLYGWDNLPLSIIFGSFWGLFSASVTRMASIGVSIHQNDCWNVAVNSCYLLSGQRKHYFWSKTTPKDHMVKKACHLARYLGHFGPI